MIYDGLPVEAKLENFNVEHDESEPSTERFGYRKQGITERREGRSRDRRSLYDVMQR